MVASYISIVKAAYVHKAESDDELSLVEDQLYFVLEDGDADWWKVRLKSDNDEEPSGLVPAGYLEEVDFISTAKAIYAYEATADGELSIDEDEVLHVYEKEDDWWLVKSTEPGGRTGLVPASYVEDTDTASVQETPAKTTIPSHYTDPAELVAASHNTPKPDTIQTWAVTEIDKKGKKKKGTLGIGNGNMFFASESDKAPVQQWPCSSVSIGEAEKAKHVMFSVDGTSLHFNAGSTSTAEAIVAKLEASQTANAKILSTPPPRSSSPPRQSHTSAQTVKAKKSVNFAAAPAEVIAAPDSDNEYGDASGDAPAHGISGTILYDFAAEGEDELAVHAGEVVSVIDRDGSEDWWKVQNVHGAEGVVPRLYVEVEGENDEDTSSSTHVEASQLQAHREAEEREVEEKAYMEKQRHEEAEAARRSQDRDREVAAAAEEAKRKRLADQKAAEIARLEREAVRAASSAQKPQMPARPSASGSERKSSVPTTLPDKAKTRVWHDRTGQFRVEAQFLGMKEKKLRLHKTNGVIIEVPMDKMSPTDITYIQKVTNPEPVGRTSPDEDIIPLAQLPVAMKSRPSSSSAARQTPTSKRPTTDWFEFFLNAGCDVDDCTRYSTAFERDKIDETILPDLEASTLRTLGLREGDIIRVLKAVKDKSGKSGGSQQKNEAVTDQMRKDEALARQLQEQDGGPSPSPAPNLFASGSNGALKTQTRRGRPTPRETPSANSVNAATLSTVTSDLKSSSPRIRSPVGTSSSPAPERKATGGFDDDAWAPRPSSTVGIKSTTPQPQLITPTPTPPPPPPQPVTSFVASTTTVQPPPRPSTAGAQPNNQSSTEEEDMIQRIRALRPPSAPIGSQQTGLNNLSSSPTLTPPVSYHAGLRAGNSPAPISQFQTPFISNVPSPRGPFAPVPANQSLLAPLVPTTTGFSGFVPTRSPMAPQPTGLMSPGGQPPFIPSFIPSQPTGMMQSPPNATGNGGGFQPQPLQNQQLGFQANFAAPAGINNFGMNNGGFQPVPPPNRFQPQPQQQFQGGSLFDSLARGPQPPSPAPANNTSPASVFASMKAGNFGANTNAPQSSDKYDALRGPTGQQSFLAQQPTGWSGPQQGNFGGVQPQQTGFQPNGFNQPLPTGFQPQPPSNGFQNGYPQMQTFNVTFAPLMLFVFLPESAQFLRVNITPKYRECPMSPGFHLVDLETVEPASIINVGSILSKNEALTTLKQVLTPSISKHIECLQFHAHPTYTSRLGAFVTFHSTEYARQALQTLRRHTIHSHVMGAQIVTTTQQPGYYLPPDISLPTRPFSDFRIVTGIEGAADNETVPPLPNVVSTNTFAVVNLHGFIEPIELEQLLRLRITPRVPIVCLQVWRARSSQALHAYVTFLSRSHAQRASTQLHGRKSTHTWSLQPLRDEDLQICARPPTAEERVIAKAAVMNATPISSGIGKVVPALAQHTAQAKLAFSPTAVIIPFYSQLLPVEASAFDDDSLRRNSLDIEAVNDVKFLPKPTEVMTAHAIPTVEPTSELLKLKLLASNDAHPFPAPHILSVPMVSNQALTTLRIPMRQVNIPMMPPPQVIIAAPSPMQPRDSLRTTALLPVISSSIPFGSVETTLFAHRPVVERDSSFESSSFDSPFGSSASTFHEKNVTVPPRPNHRYGAGAREDRENRFDPFGDDAENGVPKLLGKLILGEPAQQHERQQYALGVPSVTTFPSPLGERVNTLTLEGRVKRRFR